MFLFSVASFFIALQVRIMQLNCKILTKEISVLHQLLHELRDIKIQNNRTLFRQNLKKFGRIAAYEISKELNFENITSETSLGEANSKIIADEIVLCPILRAGLPLYEGVLDTLCNADSAFVSAYRRHSPDGSFDIHVSYLTCPDLTGKVLICIDPMFATGASFDAIMNEIKDFGKPKLIYFLTVISSKQALEFLTRRYPNVRLITGAVDEELTAKAYIVPGLGDAGDLAFGNKLQE